ncbi:MAG: hypothetical protein R2708_23110 [Vicinamibacterales bacterium]
MRLFRRHLDDPSLAQSLVDRIDAHDAAHLESCRTCQRRRARLDRRFRSLRTAATAAADAAFPADALERQRASILDRIARRGERRVLAFPGHAGAPAPGPVATPDRRWVMAAAAAGLLLGVAVGQLPHRLSSPPAAPVMAKAPAAPAPAAVRRDDTLLSDVEELLTLEVRPEFGALDGLTPIAYETR